MGARRNDRSPANVPVLWIEEVGKFAFECIRGQV